MIKELYRFRFSNEIIWHEDLTIFHNQVAENSSIDEFTAGDVYVILEELVSNYFKYAIKPEYKLGIDVSISVSEDVIEIVMEYEGDDFNPFNFEITPHDDDVDKIAIGGKGIYMVKKLADSYFYLREAHLIKLIIFKNRLLELDMNITEKLEGNILVLSLDGRLDIMSCDLLQKKFDEIIDVQKQFNILVECEKLAFISSAGLRLFMIALKRLNKVQGKMAFCSFNLNNRKIFDITGYSKFFSIYDTYQEAVSAF